MKRRLAIRFMLAPLLLACVWAQPAAAWTPAGKSRIAGAPARAKSHAKARAPVGDLWARSDLFFGAGKPDGSMVTEEEFKQFLDTVVTPRFPDGLTLLTGFGQYRNQAGTIVQERSMLLILLYPKRNNATNALIEEIREAYKAAFQQESVLRVDTKGRVSF
jgi:hypothetical protein